jgi:ribosomal protein S18 acetylase RimI-like enzyme
MEIRKLQSNAEAEACARMMAESEPWTTVGRSYAHCLGIIADPAREVYLAADGLTLVGFVVLNMHGAFVGYIQTLCVAPAFRNRRIGSRLIAFAEARIFTDSPNAFMCVSSFNTGARRLYERLGYAVVGELTDYVVAGHSEILLRKTSGPLTEFGRK